MCNTFHMFKMYNLVHFEVWIQLLNHHQNQNNEHTYPPQKFLCAPL